ncbi:MAG: hypothetical protein KDB27_27300 [Planctomycetales bacterium]|nr:hypothetical protein [Planctomycetales bacterium]
MKIKHTGAAVLVWLGMMTNGATAQTGGYFSQVTKQTSSPTFVSVDSSAGVQQANYNSDCGIPGTDCKCEDGCAECSQLWQNACSEPGLGGGLLNNPGFSRACVDACSGILSDGGQCAGACSSGGCGVWAHYTTIFSEFLYLRPRNADIAYAVPIDGPITQAPANNPIQVGRIAVVDPDYETGYAAGINLALNPLSSINVRFSSIDFQTSDQISTTAPNVIRSIVSHPSSQSTQTDFLSASASLGIDYDNIDLTFRHLFVGGDVFAVNYFLGARYSQLDQHFNSMFVDNETEQVTTDVDFEGVGLRLGFEAERHSCFSRLRYYTRGAANFLAGRFRADYFQGTTFDPTIVDTYWEAGRVVPSLDLEIGVGWRSESDRFRMSVGYRVDAWFNMVTNEDFVYAVQQNNYLGMEDTISFDGLVAQAELRF